MSFQFFKNLRLGTKLLAGFGIVLVIMVIVALTAVVGMTQATQKSASTVTEHLPQLTIASQIAEMAKDTQYVVRAYTSTEDSSFLESARANIEAISNDFSKLRNIDTDDIGKRKLVAISQRGAQTMERYSSLLANTETAINELQTNRADVNTRANEFVEKTREIRETFTGELTMEIESGDVILELLGESLDRIDVVNTIISNGQNVFTRTWRAIAEQDPQLVIEANGDFETILSDLQKAQASTMDFYIRGLVDEIIATCESYQTAAQRVTANWEQLNQYMDELSTIGNELSDMTLSFSTESMNRVTTDTNTNQVLLSNSRNIVIALTIIAVILGVGIAIFITRSMTKPMNEILEVVEAIAEGNLTKESKQVTKDEIGILGQSLNKSLANLRAVLRETLDSSDILAQSAGQMTETAGSMLEKSTDMNDRSTTVAAAGEELSANISTMSKTADELSSSAQSVASAVEQMSASINEVAHNCAKESEIAGQANREAESARSVMSELGESANQISKIVEIINNIAAQTNLLALNATIEAASAGEAGKGFAVVANEVKDLARQSAQATEQISKQIEEMQSKTHTSITTINSITEIIEEVSSIAVTIASAVEEQSVTTNEISSSLGNVSEAINQLAINIQHAASGATEVSENIQEVSFAAKESVEGANNTSSAAHELTEIAKTLREQVGKFKV
ncbi:MAG: methyl-accepting chemotaxis protein [Puniceicoccaceae bacterium]